MTSGGASAIRFRVGEPSRALWIRVLIVTGVCLFAYGWNFFDLAWWFWLSEPNYSHGILVPVIAAAILYQRRHILAQAERYPAQYWFFGLLGLAATLALRSWFYHKNEQWFENLTILPAYFFALMSLGGWGMVRWCWPGVLFLVFMLPFPGKLDAVLAQPLQTMASTGSVMILQSLRIPVLQEGNTLFINGQHLEVARACSGLSMMLSLTCLVAAAVILVERPWWQRLTLLFSAIPIALVSNILRITVTALAYLMWNSVTVDEYAHDFAGFLMMPVGLLLVILELWVLSKIVRIDEVETAGGTTREKAMPWFAPAGAAPGVGAPPGLAPVSVVPRVPNAPNPPNLGAGSAEPKSDAGNDAQPAA